MGAGRVDQAQIAFHDQQRLVVVRRSGQHVAVRIGDERRAPELQLAFGPTRLGAATNTPLAMAWLRIIVSQAACWLGP